MAKAHPRRRELLTQRGEHTRGKLVVAAREVFERDGFAAARITEIAALADTAVGSFYTYFDTKDAILRAVMEVVDGEFALPLPREAGTDPLARLEAGNLAYVRNYARNARILAVMQHRSFDDHELGALRTLARRRWIERAERSIRRLRDAGRASSGLSPRFLATALSSMVQAFCYEHFAFDDGSRFSEEEIADGLTDIWIRAVGIAAGRRDARIKPAR